MEFSYLSTTTTAEWERWAGRNIEVQEGAIGLGTEIWLSGEDLEFDAVDVALDPDGTIYALRGSGDVWKYDEEREFAAAVWTNDDELADPRGICVAGDRIYLVGDDPDLVVISDSDGELAGRIDASLADPVALVQQHRKTYVLDRGDDDEAGRVAVYDGRGNAKTVLRGLDAPRDFAVDGAGNVSIIEMTDDGPVISVFESRYVDSPDAFPQRRTISSFAVPDADDTFIPNCLVALSDQELVVHGRLSLSGDPATYHYRGVAGNGGEFERCVGFDVPCSRLVLGPQHGRGRPPTYYAVATEGDDIYMIEETERHRQRDARPSYSGIALRRFDAGVRDTQWHRVSLEFDSLPASTQVVVSYYAANSEDRDISTIDGVNENDETDLREAGVVGPWDLLEHDPEEIATIVSGATVERARDWRENAIRIVNEGGTDTWTAISNPNPEDALLREADGRYLHVRLELVGEVETSPRVSSFRAYCPRQSYDRYLPETYRGDAQNARFLERFLSIFESAYVDIEEEFETITRYFDPEGIPSEYLPWLTQWLAVEHDAGWPEAAQREFLARAPDLFRQRGTRGGMRAYLEIYLSHVDAPDTSWIEDWQRSRIEARRDEGYLDDETAEELLESIDERTDESASDHLLFFIEHRDMDGIESSDAVQSYAMHMRGTRSFVVFVGPFVREDHRDAVERMVESEKPAHVDGNVIELRQHCQLKGNSFLGINTALTPREFTLGQATLGGETVLKEREEFR